MICPNCGTENRTGAKFCTECATALTPPCPNCGTANPPGAKFCSECATPLSPGAQPAGASAAGAIAGAPQPAAAAPVSERRLVSVLFADIVGFTPFSEERDAEEVRETLGRYFDLAREIVDRYGGTVEKFIGDAVMAVWGTPVAQEDDAERAVRAALELIDAIPAIAPGIQARCGVLTGEAAVTIGATNQGMVAGDIVNTASRLQSAAAPGTVLVGESTQRAAGGIAFEEAGPQSLKGKAAPVPAWRALRVVAEVGGRNRSETLEAPFVGRDEELRLVKDLFHATGRDRKPRLISVMGPGGIGKSRLAWEFLKYVDGLAGQVWWHAGRSPAYGEGITFWALGEMVRGRAGLVESDEEETTREKVAAIVSQHVPDAEERRWIQAALLALLGQKAEIGSEQLFAAWRMFFERLAATAPVVMVFEDLHHADPGLLDFIAHLMEWSRDVPITVVTLARPELLEKRPDWGAGARTFTSLHLDPLPELAMRELLAAFVPGLPAQAADRIVERADGIPLYAVETVRMLLADGRLVAEGGAYRPTSELDDIAVPETLTALIAARLDALSTTDRALLEDAAVLGQSFTLAALAAVSGADTADLERRLRDLVRRELLTLDADPRSPERGQYSFMQSLIREVAYNTLAKRDRKTRHLAAARYLESLGTDEVAGALAGHYAAARGLATDTAEADALGVQARIALSGAADRAAALGSFEQAVTFLEQALEVTEDPRERARLHERARDAAVEGLDDAPIERHADGAAEAWRQTGDRAAIARALTERLILEAERYGDAPRAARAMLEVWEEFSDLEDSPEGLLMMSAVAAAHSGLDHPEEAMAWVERFMPTAERLDDIKVICRGLGYRANLLNRQGRFRESAALYPGVLQLSTAAGFRTGERHARTQMTFLAQWDAPAEGLRMAREGLEIAGRTGSRSYGFTMVGNGTVCALRVGDWAWAESLLEEWLPLDRGTGWYMELHIDRAILQALRGADPTSDLDEAGRLRQETSDRQYEAYEHLGRAWAAFASGDYTEARRAAGSAGDAYYYFPALAAPLGARAALWEGDPAGARQVVADLQKATFRGRALALDLATIQAGASALEGNGFDALTGYREAIRGWRELGLTFDEALAVTDMATFLPERERTSAEVRAAAEEARATLERLGAQPILDRLNSGRTDAGTGAKRPTGSKPARARSAPQAPAG